MSIPVTKSGKHCRDCAFAAGLHPATCGLWRDPDTGAARLAFSVRADASACGPDGAHFEQAKTPAAKVLGIGTLPKAGRFA